jgi:hypothetical protein
MDNQLNYRQARQIRNRSVSDLIADELIRGKGIGGAIGGALGLKSKARMKGIREKFDLLNVVRTLTGKSRLATSLIGKIFGRSREDIEYFAGRASPIGERRKKITGLSGQGEGEDTNGMKMVLNQILKFLQKSHEKDMILREKENNLRESLKLDDDRRHTELLKALKNIGFDGGETATKEKESSLLDGIMSIINGLKQQIQSFIEDIKDIKNILTGFNWLSKLGSLGRLATALFTGAAGAIALAAIGVAFGLKLTALGMERYEENASKAAQEGDIKALREAISSSSQIQMGAGSEFADPIAQQENVDARVKQMLQDEAAKGNEKAKEALAKMNYDDAIYEKQKEYLKSKGIDLEAGDKVTAKQLEESKAYAVGKVNSSSSLPIPAASSSSSSSEEGMKNYVPRFTPPPVPPPAVDITPKSSAVNAATDTNVSLNLPSVPTSAEKNQAAQNKTNVINKNTATGQKVPMPLVRNKEETFQRMIYNSLRLV